MRTSIAAAGQPTGVPTAAPVIEPQWPAVSTVSGAISVPVHKKLKPKVISAIDVYLPAGAFVPPTMAFDGDATAPSPARAAVHAIRVLRRCFKGTSRWSRFEVRRSSVGGAARNHMSGRRSNHADPRQAPGLARPFPFTQRRAPSANRSVDV